MAVTGAHLTDCSGNGSFAFCFLAVFAGDDSGLGVECKPRTIHTSVALLYQSR